MKDNAADAKGPRLGMPLAGFGNGFPPKLAEISVFSCT